MIPDEQRVRNYCRLGFSYRSSTWYSNRTSFPRFSIVLVSRIAGTARFLVALAVRADGWLMRLGMGFYYISLPRRRRIGFLAGDYFAFARGFLFWRVFEVSAAEQDEGSVGVISRGPGQGVRADTTAVMGPIHQGATKSAKQRAEGGRECYFCWLHAAKRTSWRRRRVASPATVVRGA